MISVTELMCAKHLIGQTVYVVLTHYLLSSPLLPCGVETVGIRILQTTQLKLRVSNPPKLLKLDRGCYSNPL